MRYLQGTAGFACTVADLFALALGDALFFGNVREAHRPSGFSLLAQSLHVNQAVVRYLSTMTMAYLLRTDAHDGFRPELATARAEGRALSTSQSPSSRW